MCEMSSSLANRFLDGVLTCKWCSHYKVDGGQNVVLESAVCMFEETIKSAFYAACYIYVKYYNVLHTNLAHISIYVNSIRLQHSKWHLFLNMQAGWKYE